MEILSTFSFKDLIAFAVPVIITALFFNRRRKRKSIRVNCSFLFIVLSVGSALEIWGNIYETFSYRNNHLYNNDKFTTVFNYDIPKIVFFPLSLWLLLPFSSRKFVSGKLFCKIKYLYLSARRANKLSQPRDKTFSCFTRFKIFILRGIRVTNQPAKLGHCPATVRTRTEAPAPESALIPHTSSLGNKH
jgi:hypothetical protein